jgi:undecaprenyl-diphosphatase
LTGIEATLLGILQGLTEFLPVSSTGHLSLVPVLFGTSSPTLAFDVALHLGTLVSTLVYFRTDVWRVLAGAGRMCRAVVRWECAKVFADDQWARLASLIAIAMLPTVVVGLALRNATENVAETRPDVVAGLLLATGVLLLVVDRAERRGGDTAGARNTRGGVLQAAVVGTAQGIAALPGISRSGSCIAAGILAGLEREFAVRFAFLLMIPAVVAAVLLKAHDLGGSGGDLSTCALGVVAAALSGLAAIWLTIRCVRSRRLWVFGLYCIGFGILSLAVLAARGRLGAV